MSRTPPTAQARAELKRQRRAEQQRARTAGLRQRHATKLERLDQHDGCTYEPHPGQQCRRRPVIAIEGRHRLCRRHAWALGQLIDGWTP